MATAKNKARQRNRSGNLAKFQRTSKCAKPAVLGFSAELAALQNPLLTRCGHSQYMGEAKVALNIAHPMVSAIQRRVAHHAKPGARRDRKPWCGPKVFGLWAYPGEFFASDKAKLLKCLEELLRRLGAMTVMVKSTSELLLRCEGSATGANFDLSRK